MTKAAERSGAVDLSRYDNRWFRSRVGASRAKQFVWYLVNVLFFLNPLNISSALKVRLLRIFGARVGHGVVLKPRVNIKYPWKLVIGDHCWIGEDVWIDNLETVSVGNNVCISQGAMLLTGNHDFTSPTFALIVKSIILENGAWIGAQSVVCPGVTCGTHSVLAVQSVATKNLLAYTINQGNPAAFVRERIIAS